MQVEIDQGEVRAEPVMVLRDATIAHPVEAEDAFQDAEHMFYFRSYFRLGCVLSFRFFVHIVFELRPAAGHVLRVWRGLVDGLRLALISACRHAGCSRMVEIPRSSLASLRRLSP